MKKLLNLGISESLKPFQVSLVRFSNIGSLVFFIYGVSFFLLVLFYKPQDATFILILLIPPVLNWIFNSQQLSIIARPLFLISGLLAITAIHGYFLMPDEGLIFHLLFAQFNFFILFWLIIDARERGLLFPTLIFMLVIFFASQKLNENLNASESLPVLQSSWVKLASYFFNLCITFMSLYAIQKRNISSEENIEKLKKELNVKTEGLTIKEKELNQTLLDISESHKEEDKRNWISNGLSRINAILRGSDEDIYRKVLLGIINHAKLLYGGIYELDEEKYGDKFLLLKASYGFNKESIQKKRFEIDDGLLSSAYHEREIVHLIEIPEKYSKIESGLGESHPSSLVILPLIYEGKIEGIIELASFNKLEVHEIEFMKRVATILARFIEAYKSDSKTKELLERTQQQTEEMRAQEEEMRQNMEELQATQEELHRKEQEYLIRIKNLEEQLKK